MERDNILLHLPSFFIYFLFISSFCYCYWCFFNFSIPLLCRFDSSDRDREVNIILTIRIPFHDSFDGICVKHYI
ncbi:hypothetical protein Peur_040002 [Populus x canadensis]